MRKMMLMCAVAALLPCGEVRSQQSVESALLKGSPFTGTGLRQNQSTYSPVFVFYKEEEKLMAQYGSSAPVPVAVSGNRLSMKYRVGDGREIETILTLHEDGSLKGMTTGPYSGGRAGSFQDALSLKATP